MVKNKRPLVGVSLLFCGGILVASVTRPHFIGSGLVIALVGAAFLGLYHTRFHSWAFFPLPFLAGLFVYYDSAQPHCRSDLRNRLGDTAHHVAVRGIVCDWPETRVKESPRGEFGRTSWMLAATAIRRAESWEPALGNVLVQFEEPGVRKELAYGDELELVGAIQRPPISRNPGQFDYRQYLARQGVYYDFRLASTGDLTVLATRRGNWTMQIAADANEYFKKCLAMGIGDEEEMVGLLRAIVLGFRPGLTNELADPFMKTGTLHVFAVSGYHIALMASILVGGLRFCRLSRQWSGLVSIPLLLIYTLITGAPPSATRSFVMASVLIFSWSLWRPYDIFNSLAAAAIIVLTMSPQQLFDVGFQLSFFAVLAIALFAPRVHDRLVRWAKPDPFLPWDVVPKWRRWIFFPLNKCLLCFAVSFAAVAGSTPLIANYFHLVTPVALISNLLIVPLTGIVIALGFGSMVAGGLLPWATQCFNNTSFLLMHVTLGLNDWFAQLPFAYFYVVAWPWPLLVFYYAVTGAFLSGWAFQNKTTKVVSFTAGALFLAVVTTYCLRPRDPTITVLDVGGGQAVLVNQRGSNDLLVDGGRRSQGDSLLRPYLRSQGIGHLGAILLTVNDINHAGGLIPVVQRIPFDAFYESECPSRSRDYRELIELLSSLASHAHRERVYAGIQHALAPDIHLRILHPLDEKAHATAEDNSVVFILECAGHRILFKSNIGETVEDALAQGEADLRSDIVVTGQHPKEPCCTDGFLDKVQPDTVIINAGSFPTYAYPRQDMLDRLRRRHVTIYRTDECGGIVITLRSRGYEIKPTLDAPR